jgi:hypothetical protein
MQSVRDSRPGKRSAIILTVVLPVIGAAVGAATHSTSDFRYQAEAVMVADANVLGIAEPSHDETSGRILAEAVELPPVVAAARTTADSERSIEEIVEHTHVEWSRGGGLARVVVEETSEERALALANAIAFQAMDFLRRVAATQGDRPLVLGDFEETTSDWVGSESIFNTPPQRVERTLDEARYGSASLKVECPATPACGPTVRLYNRFEEGMTYTAEGYAKSTIRVPVTMVIGSSPKDVVTGPVRHLGLGWTRLQVTWTPSSNRSFAELGFQTVRGRRPASFYIDGVSLAPPRASPSSSGRAFEKAQKAVVVPARPTQNLDESGATVVWALRGAVLGFAVALAAIGLGLAAHRREHSKQNPDA